MAGRPVTMAKRARELEIAADELDKKVLQIMPKRCLEANEPKDPIGKAWRDLLYATTLASWLAMELTSLLYEKAGIPEDLPIEQEPPLPRKSSDNVRQGQGDTRAPETGRSA